MRQVVTLGAWHLGSVTSACLAKAGASVSLWDQSEAVAASWSQGRAPIFEPGLEERVQGLWGQRLSWAGPSVASRLREADWIVIAYDTPVDNEDRLQTKVLEEAMELLVTNGFNDGAHVFVTAQVPVGTTGRWRARLRERHPSWKGHMLYMPENLRLGEALRSFEAPDRVVLGVDVESSAEREKILAAFREFAGLAAAISVEVMGLESAEMVKHALNAFLGTCVVFANQIADACEWHGANAWDVLGSLKKDGRVGPRAFLRPGLGFAGGTIGRDLRTLEGFEHAQGIQGGFFSGVYAANAKRNDWVVKTLVHELGDLRDKRIALLGVTYKVGTSTVRRSPSFDLATDLKRKGALVSAYDPKADYSELTASERQGLALEVASDVKACLRGSDAAVLMTEWPEFAGLDFRGASSQVRQKLVIDTKNFWKAEAVEGWKRVVPGVRV